jgi:hypothetical protein
MTREPWVPRRLVTGILVAVVLIGPAIAAEDQGDAAAQANNPLANMTALNFRNYLIGRITDTDEDGNQFWLRFVKCAWPRILVYNFENDAYSIPLGIGIGIGIGQLVKRGKTVFNSFVEPQASVAYRGPGQPDSQVFAGFNTRFLQ